MIGISVSHCIKDILNGKVQVEEVEKIISSTRCISEEDWNYIFELYYISYWGKHPRQECLDLFNKIRPIIEQPKLKGKRVYRPSGYWVNSEEEITYSSYL